MNAQEKNNALCAARGWALRNLVQENRERYQAFLDSERAKVSSPGNCLGHRAQDCLRPGAGHDKSYRSLFGMVASRARTLLSAEEDLKPRYAELKASRLVQLAEGTVETFSPSALAEEARTRLEASRGTWLPLRDYEADKRRAAVDYAWTIRTGRAKAWLPAGDFDAEVRWNDDGGLTVWAVWMGDGDA